MPAKRRAMPRPAKAAASKGVNAFSQKKRSVPTGYREVFIAGIPYGIVHLVGMQGSVTDQRTLCDNYPGRTPAPSADQKKCPVCWRDRG